MQLINPSESMFAGVAPSSLPHWAQPNRAFNPRPPSSQAAPNESGCIQCGDIPCCAPNVCKPYHVPSTGETFYHCVPPVSRPSSLATRMGPLGKIPGAGLVFGAADRTLGAVRTLGSNPASVADRDEMCGCR